MEIFAPYGHAIFSLAGFALIGLLLNPLSAAKKAGVGIESGALPKPDYSDPVYRWSRAYMNAMEMSGLYAGAVLSAILSGASPFWVNLLAAIFLLSRIAVAFVHIRGLGQANQGPRTMLFVVGWAISIILALMAIFNVFS